MAQKTIRRWARPDARSLLCDCAPGPQPLNYPQWPARCHSPLRSCGFCPRHDRQASSSPLRPAAGRASDWWCCFRYYPCILQRALSSPDYSSMCSRHRREPHPRRPGAPKIRSGTGPVCCSVPFGRPAHGSIPRLPPLHLPPLSSPSCRFGLCAARFRRPRGRVAVERRHKLARHRRRSHSGRENLAITHLDARRVFRSRSNPL